MSTDDNGCHKPLFLPVPFGKVQRAKLIYAKQNGKQEWEMRNGLKNAKWAEECKIVLKS